MRLTTKRAGNYDFDENNEIIAVADKLGQYEDIEEKHNIKSFDDLDNRLEALEIIKDIITIDSRDIGDNRVCVILDGTSKIQKENFDLLKEVVNGQNRNVRKDDRQDGRDD